MRKHSVILFIILTLVMLSTIFPVYADALNDETAKTIYADDEGIEMFLSLFNEAHPELALTSDMIHKYYHHGREHDDQVKFVLNDYEITLSNTSGFFSRDGFEMSVYIDNPTTSNEGIQELFFLFVSFFDNSLSDEVISSYWEQQTDNGSSNIDTFGNIECWTNMFNGRVEYTKIEGILPRVN